MITRSYLTWVLFYHIQWNKSRHKYVMTTHVLTLWQEQFSNFMTNVCDNNAFFVEIISTLMAIKSSFERSYDKQNITLMVTHKYSPNILPKQGKRNSYTDLNSDPLA